MLYSLNSRINILTRILYDVHRTNLPIRYNNIGQIDEADGMNRVDSYILYSELRVARQISMLRLSLMNLSH